VAGPTSLPAVLVAALLAQGANPGDRPAPAPAEVEAGLRAEVDRLTAAAASVRHLPFRGPLPIRRVDADTLRDDLTALLAGDSGSSGPTLESPFLRRLGLIPRATSFTRLHTDRYASARIPTYDPQGKRLVVPELVPLGELKPALPHAIAHALADGRFGFRRTLQIGADGHHRLSGDAERARLALIEGDATLTELELSDPRETFLAPRALQALVGRARQGTTDGDESSWLTALGQFTHIDGLLFVARVRARQTWRAVDRLWDDPPASTEQVLHPERYEACDEPLPIDEAALPSVAGYGRPMATAVLGELVIRSWLAETLPPEIAERAAAGWGGDRAALYGPSSTDEPGRSAPDGGAEPDGLEPPLVWLTVWDDASEAEDFVRAAAASGVGALARRDDAVAVVLGEVDDAPAVLTRTLDGWRHPPAASRRRPGVRPPRAARPDCPRRDRAAAPR